MFGIKDVRPSEVVMAALLLFCTQHEESILYVSYQHQGEEARVRYHSNVITWSL